MGAALGVNEHGAAGVAETGPAVVPSGVARAAAVTAATRIFFGRIIMLSLSRRYLEKRRKRSRTIR
ncbi:hypothetical protein MTP03_22330 [Tsukamurella sp. PLM1]|nr:hypothetical protein MTP03_22330 [Tsukamurella sp. PLM1]